VYPALRALLRANVPARRTYREARLCAPRVLLSARGWIADDISFDIAAPALFLYFSSRHGAPENKLFNLY
jgi:hypothetical protein